MLDGPYQHVSKEDWISAERSAGFRPNGYDYGQPATGGFSNLTIRGSVVNLEYYSDERYRKYDPKLAEAVNKVLEEKVTLGEE